jgi:hypothetical protein
MIGELTVGFLDPKFYPGLTFIGKVTQLNVWRRVLQPSEISKISGCQEDVTGDEVSWGRNWTQFTVQTNSRTFETDLGSLCRNWSFSTTQLLPPMNFVESTYVCEGLGGTLLTPTSHDQAKRMVESAMTSSNCTTFWTGVWDFIEEGSWINHQNGSVMKNVPWAPDEPNGMHFENCGALDAQGVADDDCQAKRQVGCTFVISNSRYLA